MEDDINCYFVSSASAGFCAVMVGSPIDVIKTRIMNAQGDKKYKGIFDCLFKTFRNEGFFAFYKGFKPNAIRTMSFNICMFVTWQEI